MEEKFRFAFPSWISAILLKWEILSYRHFTEVCQWMGDCNTLHHPLHSEDQIDWKDSILLYTFTGKETKLFNQPTQLRKHISSPNQAPKMMFIVAVIKGILKKLGNLLSQYKLKTNYTPNAYIWDLEKATFLSHAFLYIPLQEEPWPHTQYYQSCIPLIFQICKMGNYFFLHILFCHIPSE